jgi:hypothetical protein
MSEEYAMPSRDKREGPMPDDEGATFDEWAILELMGHKRLAGKVCEHVIAGAAFVRIDVPGVPGHDDRPWLATQFYSPGAVYCITPVSEDVARQIAARTSSPVPVTKWELERPTAPVTDEDDFVLLVPVDDDDFEAFDGGWTESEQEAVVAVNDDFGDTEHSLEAD